MQPESFFRPVKIRGLDVPLSHYKRIVVQVLEVFQRWSSTRPHLIVEDSAGKIIMYKENSIYRSASLKKLKGALIVIQDSIVSID